MTPLEYLVKSATATTSLRRFMAKCAAPPSLGTRVFLGADRLASRIASPFRRSQPAPAGLPFDRWNAALDQHHSMAAAYDTAMAQELKGLAGSKLAPAYAAAMLKARPQPTGTAAGLRAAALAPMPLRPSSQPAVPEQAPEPIIVKPAPQAATEHRNAASLQTASLELLKQLGGTFVSSAVKAVSTPAADVNLHPWRMDRSGKALPWNSELSR